MYWCTHLHGKCTFIITIGYLITVFIGIIILVLAIRGWMLCHLHSLVIPNELVIVQNTTYKILTRHFLFFSTVHFVWPERIIFDFRHISTSVLEFWYLPLEDECSVLFSTWSHRKTWLYAKTSIRNIWWGYFPLFLHLLWSVLEETFLFWHSTTNDKKKIFPFFRGTVRFPLKMERFR